MDHLNSINTSEAGLIGPNPRVISDDVWAKLLWAILNLSEDDLPRVGKGRNGQDSPAAKYPLQLVRAVAATWGFAALRCDEISRLPLHCIRWQPPPTEEEG